MSVREGWLSFRPDHDRVAPPPDVEALLGDVKKLVPAMTARRTSSDGIQRTDLRDVVAGGLVGRVKAASSASRFHPEELDFVAIGTSAAISLHAGRAWNNNAALLAVLASSADPAIEWLILVTPDRYKNSPAANNIRRQLRSLTRADGVALSLIGVACVVY